MSAELQEKLLVDELRWYEDYAEGGDNDQEVSEYDISSTPNDFNVLTIYSFIESKRVIIPGFQRNYVWDRARASRLIESLIMGLPVPQIFLYEESKNRFLVIDGQQRLMSIYFFFKKRFPRLEKRAELRKVFDRHGVIPEGYLNNDDYFEPFTLLLRPSVPDIPNPLRGRDYDNLGDYLSQFELRPLRNVVVKQNEPRDDDSSVYEIFNRLNTGGVNLSPQEIRTSLFHSAFYDMLYRINASDEWRRLLGRDDQDLHMKDVEILLRGFAVLMEGDHYSPSMIRFLNRFSKKARGFDAEILSYLETLFASFLSACSDLPTGVFNRRGKFSIALFEATFYGVCRPLFDHKQKVVGYVDPDSITSLEEDEEFAQAARYSTTKTESLKRRLERALATIRTLEE